MYNKVYFYSKHNYVKNIFNNNSYHNGLNTSNIDNNTLLITDEISYLKIYKQHPNACFITKNEAIEMLTNNYTNTSFYKRHAKILNKLDKNIWNLNLLTIKQLSTVILNPNESQYNKYLYTISTGILNNLKRSNLIKSNTLKLKKEYLKNTLGILYSTPLTSKKYKDIETSFLNSSLVDSYSNDYFTIKSTNQLTEDIEEDDGVLHVAKYNILRTKFTKKNFLDLMIQFSLSRPTRKSKGLVTTFNTYKIAKQLQTSASNISKITKGMLKAHKKQVSLIKNNGKDYSYKMYSNQSYTNKVYDSKFDHNYWVSPIGTRLFTNIKFKSFVRVGDNLVPTDKFETLSFKDRVKYVKNNNLIDFISGINQLEDSVIMTYNHENRIDNRTTTNGNTYDDKLQFVTVCKDRETEVKKSILFFNIVGLTKILYNSNVLNTSKINMNQSIFKVYSYLCNIIINIKSEDSLSRLAGNVDVKDILHAYSIMKKTYTSLSKKIMTNNIHYDEEKDRLGSYDGMVFVPFKKVIVNTNSKRLNIIDIKKEKVKTLNKKKIENKLSTLNYFIEKNFNSIAHSQS